MIFSTTRYRVVSFANNFGLDAKSSDKSFMYIRKNNDPSIEPCGTPTSIAALEECCPIRTTLCFHQYRKSVITRPVIKENIARVADARQNNVLLLWRAILNSTP